MATKIADLLADLDVPEKNGANGNGEVRYCDCHELIIGGKRQPMPHGHDCEYVKARTALDYGG